MDPLQKESLFIQSPLTSLAETDEFKASMQETPRSGLHNPLKSPERYVMYGKIIQKAAARMHEPEVLDFFIKLVQRVAPKSDMQATAEVVVTRNFLDNFGGDNARFLLKGFQVPGDHPG